MPEQELPPDPAPEPDDLPAEPPPAPPADRRRWVRLEWSHYVYEFLIVALGISVPFLLDRWNQHRQEQRAARQLQENLRRELNEDLATLRSVLHQNQQAIDQYRYGIQLIDRAAHDRLDTLAHIALNLSELSDFHRSSNVYEIIVNSGEIKLIDNREILQGLQNLEESYIYMNRLEENLITVFINQIGPILFRHLQLTPFIPRDPDWFFSWELSNWLFLFQVLSEEKQDVYRQAERSILEVLALLE